MTVIVSEKTYLTGYKEIADYLKVSVITAKRYAREGMPVKRDRLRARSRVQITKGELEKWREKRFRLS